MGALSVSGYSGTPLPQKLGIREGDVVCVIDGPGNARELIAPLPPGARFGRTPQEAWVVVLFVTERRTFEAQIGALGQAVFPNRSLWIAWPKRSSGVDTDMTEDVVREVALPLGLVDPHEVALGAVTFYLGANMVTRLDQAHAGIDGLLAAAENALAAFE